MNPDTAEEFVFYKGFPYCVPEYDVNNYFGSAIEYWTTFTGHNADTGGMPSKEDIEKSQDMAMQWHYNLESMDGSAEHSGNSLGLLPQEVQGPMSVGGNKYGEDTTYTQPNNRICNSSSSYKDAIETGSFGSGTCYGQIRSGIAKLYNGPINIEDNFMGYCAARGGNLDVRTSGWRAQSFAKCGVSICGFLPELLSEGSLFVEEAAYIECNNFHFVATAYGLDQEDYATATLDATVPSASCEVNIGTEANPNIFTAEAKMPADPLTFWKYT